MVGNDIHFWIQHIKLNTIQWLRINNSFFDPPPINSRVVGNKLNDPDFLSEIYDSDIVGIVETHIYYEISEKLDIAGFSRV